MHLDNLLSRADRIDQMIMLMSAVFEMIDESEFGCVRMFAPASPAQQR